MCLLATDDLQARLVAQLKRDAKKLPGLHYGGLPAETGTPSAQEPENAPVKAPKSFDMFDVDIAEIVKAAANRKFVHIFLPLSAAYGLQN